MKAIFALAASAPLLLAAGQTNSESAADATATPVQSLDIPSYQQPAPIWRDLEDAQPEGQAECRDRIRQAREELGKPELQRETADPDEPLMIWAVDRRIDGCGVMVMKGDAADIRPIPDPPETPMWMPAQ